MDDDDCVERQELINILSKFLITRNVVRDKDMEQEAGHADALAEDMIDYLFGWAFEYVEVRFK